jgi:hypothetical protein
MPTAKTPNPDRRSFLLGGLAAGATVALSAETHAAYTTPPTQQDRSYWLQHVELVSEPVLKALKEGNLRRKMPVEAAPGQAQSRAVGTHLEALGRLLAGLAPWLELEPSPGETPKETALRNHYRDCALTGIASALDPALADQSPAWSSMRTPIHQRAQRYAAIQERLIAPDGSYPAIGRSITYRCGAFHLLADATLRNILPEPLTPPQVRCALSAVIERTLTRQEHSPAMAGCRSVSPAINPASAKPTYPPEVSTCAVQPGCRSDCRPPTPSGLYPRNPGPRKSSGQEKIRRQTTLRMNSPNRIEKHPTVWEE